MVMANALLPLRTGGGKPEGLGLGSAHMRVGYPGTGTRPVGPEQN